MGLVDHDHADTHARDAALPVGVIQAFGRDEQDFEAALYCFSHGCAVLISRKFGTDDTGRYIIEIVATLALVAH